MKILQIIWNPDPVLFQLGSLKIRWYSFFWIVALVSGAWMVNTILYEKGNNLVNFELFNSNS